MYTRAKASALIQGKLFETQGIVEELEEELEGGAMGWISWVAGAVVVLWWIWSKMVQRRKGPRLPPGPAGLPIVGSLLSIRPPVYRCFAEWGKKYGPIMTVNLGVYPNVVFSTAPLAAEALKAQDHVLGSRPPNMIAQIMNASGYDMVWAPLGPEWTTARKISNSELLSAGSLKKFREARLLEVSKLVHEIQHRVSNSSDPIVIRHLLWNVVINNMSEMVLGKRYVPNDPQAQEIRSITTDLMRLASLFNIGQFIPFLRKLDLQGSEKLVRSIKSRMNSVVDALVSNHKPNQNQGFLDTLLRLQDTYQMNHQTVGNLLWNMMAAGTDTIVSSTEWTMAELLTHPEKLARAKKEIAQIVPRGRLVDEDDVDKLTYLQWSYKESLRLHPPTPMLLPHFSTQDCKVAGYDIPARTVVHVNAFAVHRDASVWENPEEFLPERYETEDVDMRGSDLRLIPFGSGRRVCPGLRYAIIAATLMLANLIHNFEWSLPPGTSPSDVDMVEDFGIVQGMRTPISAVASTS